MSPCPIRGVAGATTRYPIAANVLPALRLAPFASLLARRPA